MASPTKCLICGSRATVEEFTERTRISCVRCGDFALTSTASKLTPGISKDEAINISGWIREHEGVTVSSEELTKLRNLPRLTVGEKAERILIQLGRKFPEPGQIPDLSGDAYLEFMAVGRLTNITELRFFIHDYLYGEMGFLIRHEFVTELGDDSRYPISPSGWAHLESLRFPNRDSQIGFIAMWFKESMDSAHAAIETAIRNSGYEPLRIDRREHNNKIDDEIVAGIRRSKFLVADFTGHRGGVYFEAGFAMGLGIPVIWLCRKDALEELHFDTRQYNHISWTEDKLPELTNALQKRIEAILGRGSLA